MAYIGVSPSNGVRRVHTYTATASQTTFSGAGAEGTSLSYKDSNFVDVYQNGVKLGDADYTATSGTSIVLGTGASASDLVVIVVFDVFSVADTVSKADGGTFDGAVTFGGGVSGNIANVSGDMTIDVAGDIILDADGGDVTIKDGGTEIGSFANSSSDFVIKSAVSDKDMIFKGNDGGSEVTALSLDMSVGGMATIANGLVLSDGNVVFAAGHGIDFSNASGSASGSANALFDDYEEGTFTPSFSSTNATFSMNYQSGNYTRVGRLVFCSFMMNLASTPGGTTSNTVSITGLPFSSATLQGTYHGGSIGHYFNFNLAQTGVLAYQTSSGASSVELKNVGDNIGETAVLASYLGSNSQIRGHIIYHAS